MAAPVRCRFVLKCRIFDTEVVYSQAPQVLYLALWPLGSLQFGLRRLSCMRHAPSELCFEPPERGPLGIAVSPG